MRRTAKLIMVTAENNNKFYDMVEHDDGSISVDYGRVGVTSTRARASMTVDESPVISTR